MSDEMDKDLPAAVWSGSFRLFGVDVKVHTLDDGQRIIEADSVQQLLEAMTTAPKDDQAMKEELEKFARWQRGLDTLG